MRLSQSSIRSLGSRFRRIDRGSEIFVYHASENLDDALRSVGMPEGAELGDSILPAPIGSVSSFNSDGGWEVHKDLPKEPRVVGQRVWRWRQWQGRYGYEEQERVVDIVRDCYQRTFIAPPAIEMQLQMVNGVRRLSSVVPANVSDGELIHCVNLYLEHFGACHVTNDPQERPAIEPRRVNWRILPQGEDPWGRVKRALERKNLGSDDNEQIIEDRQEFICSFNPSDVFVGEGGFNDYLAYVFNDEGIVVLESVQRGNAIYIFDLDWRAVSQLTKREILLNDLQEERIIHSTGWKQRLRTALTAA